MEGHCSTGQSAQRAVVPMEEEKEELVQNRGRWQARRYDSGTKHTSFGDYKTQTKQ